VLTLRGRAVVGTTLVLVLAVAGYAVYHSFRGVSPALPPGCQVGSGPQAITLDTEQAAIAATIAGVAARHQLPRQAVTIALAAALQESKLHNLNYGDRDSVGIFQQRPSQGWGPATKLEDPVYATTKFYAALTQVRGYTTMPVYQAAQDVQHSADGSAYEQWVGIATQLAGYFTGYRQTVRRPDELIETIRIPLPVAPVSAFHKIAKRRFDDISGVAVAYALRLDDDRNVASIRIGLGGVAATPIRALAAEEALTGRPWTREVVAAAAEEMARVGTPMSDHRASEAYRIAMLRNSLLKFYAETHEGARS